MLSTASHTASTLPAENVGLESLAGEILSEKLTIPQIELLVEYVRFMNKLDGVPAPGCDGEHLPSQESSPSQPALTPDHTQAPPGQDAEADLQPDNLSPSLDDDINDGQQTCQPHESYESHAEDPPPYSQSNIDTDPPSFPSTNNPTANINVNNYNHCQGPYPFMNNTNPHFPPPAHPQANSMYPPPLPASSQFGGHTQPPPSQQPLPGMPAGVDPAAYVKSLNDVLRVLNSPMPCENTISGPSMPGTQAPPSSLFPPAGPPFQPFGMQAPPSSAFPPAPFSFDPSATTMQQLLQMPPQQAPWGQAHPTGQFLQQCAPQGAPVPGPPFQAVPSPFLTSGHYRPHAGGPAPAGFQSAGPSNAAPHPSFRPPIPTPVRSYTDSTGASSTEPSPSVPAATYVTCPWPACTDSVEARAAALKAHIESAHANCIKRPANEIDCPWPECPKAVKAVKVASIGRHMETHLRTGGATCPGCGRVLSRPDALQRHLRMKPRCRDAAEAAGIISRSDRPKPYTKSQNRFRVATRTTSLPY